MENKILKYINSVGYYGKWIGNEKAFCLENLPIIDKSIVLKNFKDFLNENIIDNILINQTSGSSGEILNVFWYDLEYIQSIYEVWKLRRKYGIYPSDKYCTSHIALNINGTYFNNKVIINRNNISLSKCFLDIDSIKYYYDELNEFSPKWMLVQPSFIYAFIVCLNRLNLKLPDSIKLIELTGEYCTDNLLVELKRLYPSIQWNVVYGMQEFNVIGYGESNSLSILDKNVCLEIFDKNEKKILNGETGDIVITGLKNSKMPLLRYRTGDKGHIDKDGFLHIDCSRSNDFIKFNNCDYDGSIFWDVILRINSIFNNCISHFQVKLNKSSELMFFLVVKSKDFNVEEVEKFIYTHMKKYYCCEYHITVVLVDNIKPYQNRNKIKYFINETI